jgi:hypothetical protein
MEMTMRRLHFLVPDVPTARLVVERLLMAHVTENSIHVIAREGTPLEDLPEAGVTQRTDLVPALERGAALGGATGILGGLLAIAVPGGAVVAAATLLPALALGGSAAGAWVGAMIGLNAKSEQAKAYEDAIEAGQLLMLVDVPRERAGEIEALVREASPTMRPQWIEPHIPPLS